VTKTEALEHAGGRQSLKSGAFEEDIALAVRKQP
jgi:hypothetical protein